WSAWKFWQKSNGGAVPGISGPFDLDFFNGTSAELMAMTGPPTANKPPVVANPIPNIVNSYGIAFYTFPANTFSDPDLGQTLTYTANNLPPGITFNGPSRTFGGTALPQGTYAITITATDNGSPPLAANCSFQLTVQTNLGPQFNLDAQIRWAW